MTTSLTLEHLTKLVDGEAVAIRGKASLQPAGGAGDKVFPPTHSKSDDELRRLKPEDRIGARYAFERRRFANGETKDCVLLDSVQSQANRMEEALQALWAATKINLPVIEVDFSTFAPEIGKVTSLSAPHRIADALLRDSMHGNTLFRLSDLGRSFTNASPRNAAPLFKVCPTGLVFGLWDSTGPRGGLGAKFARTLTSEIVGVGAQCGVKTSSRIDPAGIMKDSATIFVARDRDEDGNLTWTPDLLAAEPLDPNKPPLNANDDALVKKWGKKDKAGKPSAIVHGNIAPSIDEVAGGVTIDHAEHTVVMSLAALRRLSFGSDADDSKARTVLAALGLLAVLASEARGHDLRSRCLLIPSESDRLILESIAGDGKPTGLTLSLDQAIALFGAAVNALPIGLRFEDWASKEPLKAGKPLAALTPSPKLQHLIVQSRRLAASGEDVAG